MVRAGYYYHYEKVEARRGQAFVVQVEAEGHCYLKVQTTERVPLWLKVYREGIWHNGKVELHLVGETRSAKAREIFIEINSEARNYVIFFEAFKAGLLKDFVALPRNWPTKSRQTHSFHQTKRSKSS